MLNNEASYPYPVLRTEPIDFNSSVFQSNLDVVRNENGFAFTCNFSVGSNIINDLIENNEATYAIQITCQETWYRGIISISRTGSYILPANAVHGKVVACPCIYILKENTNYIDSDFSEAYHGLSFRLRKNDIIGIGQKIKFNAYYETDTVNEPTSIMQIEIDEDSERVRVDLNHKDGYIHVFLPPLQYKNYNKAGNGTEDQRKLLHAAVHIPVLIQALCLMKEEKKDDSGDLSNNAWYKSLDATLEKIADGNPGKISAMLEDPFGTVEILLANNLDKVLTIASEEDW